MPRASVGPRLVLYGPDTKHGAKRKARFTRYLWYIVWNDGGKKHELGTGFGFGQDAEAEERFGQWLQTRRVPDTRCRRPDQITAAEVLDFYATEYASTTADPTRISYAIDALVAFLGEETMDTITAGRRRRYVKERNRSAGTVIRELGVLDAAARHCVREGHLTMYPDEQWFPDRPDPKERYLTRKEAAALIRAARRHPHDPRVPTGRHHLPLFILLGLYTGRRKESILTLQWQPNTTGGYVDLDRNVIDFYAIGKRKTKKRRGIIPIPHRLRPFLLAARRRTKQYVIEFEGKPVESVKRSFGSACKIAGLPDVHPHIMRHTLATWFAQRGVAPHQAADFLEMTLETYLRRYRKYHPDFMQEALAALR